MTNDTDAAGLAAQPDPLPDREGPAVPPFIAQAIDIVTTLAQYGRHLADTLERRAASRSFAIIARCFGTSYVAIILAHLYRGVMRAVLLERVLRARAATGRDLVPSEPGARTRLAGHQVAPAAPVQRRTAGAGG